MSSPDQASGSTPQLAEYSPTCSQTPGCQCRTEASRGRLLRDLQNASEIDLSGSHRRFVPRGRILHILDRQRVTAHLRTVLHEVDFLNELVNYISPGQSETCRCRDSLCTGSRIILASLIRIEREDYITRLYNHPGPRICDSSLPFPKQGPFPEPLNDLTEKDKELFKHAQCQLRAHYLKKLGPKDQTFRELDDEAALPLLNIKEGPKPITGEFSIVQRIRIDLGHNNLDGDQEHFALKTIKGNYIERRETIFQDEFKANQQAPRHDRIVPLLAAFKHRQKFHFIFPYASGGNLRELWETHSSSEAPGTRPAEWYSPQWLVNECLGIAQSLVATHQPTSRTELGELCNLAPQIHADIKPRNILCFETMKDGKKSFTLKLADFGFARKVNETSTLDAQYVTHTKTYRPPEHDLEDSVRLNYDVWCLGCVYLEFVTWAVLGWSEVEKFGGERIDEVDDPHTSTAKGEDYEDTFFRKVARHLRWYDFSGLTFGTESNTERPSKKTTAIVRILRVGRGNIRISCQVKNSVTAHISKVRNHPQCVPEFREFLDFIETRMLVIDTGERAGSSKVEEFLCTLAEQHYHQG